MKYRLIVKPEAEEDILLAAKWYDQHRSNLGIRFLDALDDKLSQLISNPLLFQVRYKNTRFAFLKRFPFAVHYLVEGEIVFVIAVLSTHRNPKIWKS